MPKNQYLDGQWYPWYRVISSVIGYNYFVLWSVCFYPQVLLNYRRQSTKGLSQDFGILNFMGWAFYSAYLCAMYFDDRIQALYAERFKNESSTVQSNDVAFAFTFPTNYIGMKGPVVVTSYLNVHEPMSPETDALHAKIGEIARKALL